MKCINLSAHVQDYYSDGPRDVSMLYHKKVIALRLNGCDLIIVSIYQKCIIANC